MTTFVQMQTTVSRALRDESNTTFTAAMVEDLINSGIVELSRIAPRQFQEDIDADGSLEYALDTMDSDPRIRIVRVEAWDASVTPNRQICRIEPASESLSNESEAGWKWWAGVLSIPYGYSTYLADNTKVIRVWGYAPYTQLVNDSDTTDLPDDLVDAVVEYAAWHGFDRLAADRALYTQWQTTANNTDVSFAALLNSVAVFRGNWERRRKQLITLLETG